MSRRKMAPPPSDRIFEALRYDPETGAITRKDGSDALRSGGPYHQVAFEGRGYYAHRVAWLLAGNGWPTETVDHINGDRRDNRLINLRHATHAQNNWNSRAYGKYAKGVCFNKRDRKFQAAITTNGVRRFLGCFRTEEEAASAYREAALRLHGEFARS